MIDIIDFKGFLCIPRNLKGNGNLIGDGGLRV